MALIPEGTYTGRIEKAEVRKSKKEGTKFYECICVVTEDTHYNIEDKSGTSQSKTTKGARLPFNGWLTEKAASRTIEAMIAAGCTFPNDDLDDLTGLGTKEVQLVVETEDYDPPATDDNPNPKTIRRSRVAFVNATMRQIGVALDSEEKKAFGASMKSVIAAAKRGERTGGGTSADGSKVVGGTLKSASGKDLF